MTQATGVIANGSGASVRAAITAAFGAINSGHSGTTVPSYVAGGMMYWRTDVPGSGTWTLYAYDGASSVALGTLNTSTHVWTPSNAIASSTFTTKGDLLKGGVGGTPARFGIGSAFYGLHVNSAGDDLEWRRNGWEKIADDAVPSAAANVEFTGIPSNVRHVLAEFRLFPATNAVDLRLRTSTGGSFKTGGTDYSVAGHQFYQGPANIGYGTSGADHMLICAGVASDTTSGGLSGRILFHDIQQSGWQNALIDVAQGIASGGAQNARVIGAGSVTAGAMDGMRFYFGSGNIGSGRISLFGVRS